jgi:1,4-dihydroxy-6-naphthoate synthase
MGHSPDPDDAFMFYGLAKGLIPTGGFAFEHVLQDIQTLNERARRGELDITAISFHAYAYVSAQYALLPSGASMGDGYGPMLVAKKPFTREELARRKIAVPGTMTSAFLALQLWLQRPADQINFRRGPFDQIFQAVARAARRPGLVIHEGQLTYQKEGLVLCQDLGAWWKRENDGLPLPLGGNVIHKRLRRRRARPSRAFSPPASNSASITGPKRWRTPCNTRGTWDAIWPINSWGCMSIIGRWITAKKAARPSGVFCPPGSRSAASGI